MKKTIFLGFILGFIFLSPQNLISEKFSIKIGAGLSFGGTISDLWSTTTEYFIQRIDKDVKKFSTTQIFAEIVFPVYQNFSLSVGAGNFSKILKGTKGVFTLPPSSEFSGDFFSTPEIHFQSIPILVTATWSYTVWPESKVYILGGVGYYISELNIYDHLISYDFQDPSKTLNYFPLDYHGRTSSLGYHGGVGFDVYTGNNFFFFVESVYRSVKFKKFESIFTIDSRSRAYDIVKEQLGESVAESTFLHFLNWGGDEIWGEIFYSINNIFLSEIIFQAGLRIRF
ncbi:hypothetical protein ACFLRX_06940 [Acidobacteriota bacterium]